MQSLPVMFRFSRDEVTAIFPTLPYDESRATDVTAYAHIGQHGVAAWDWIAETRPAKESEYAPLLTELRQVYHDYKLIVIS